MFSLLVLISCLACTTNAFVVSIPWVIKKKGATATATWFPYLKHHSCVQAKSAPLQQEYEQEAKDVDVDEVSFYIHIPYCRQRCHYCDFSIVPIGNHTNTNTNTKNNTDTNSKTRQEAGFESMDANYLQAILQEIQLLNLSLHHWHANHHNHKHNHNHKTKKHSSVPNPQKTLLPSIYIGGGTPSLAPLSTLHTLLTSLSQTFAVDQKAEITLEMDPGTFDFDYLHQVVRKLGVNRISLGVQSLKNGILKTIGRTHQRGDVLEVAAMLRQLHQDNHHNKNSNNDNNDNNDSDNYKAPSVQVSIDLMGGLPGLTVQLWKDTLKEAMEVFDGVIHHVSVYDLQVEEGTLLERRFVRLPDEEEDDVVEEEENFDYVKPKRMVTETKTEDTADAIKATHVNADTNLETATTTTSKSNFGTKTVTPPLPSASDCAEMYRYASRYLQQEWDFEHYEVSSYAKKKKKKKSENTRAKRTEEKQDEEEMMSYRSKHNAHYWEPHANWFAVGLGATSSLGGMRFSRPKTMHEYITWVQHQAQNAAVAAVAEGKEQDHTPWHAPWLPYPKHTLQNHHQDNNNKSKTKSRKEMQRIQEEEEEEDCPSELADIVMTRLRTSEGLNLSWVYRTYGVELVNSVLCGVQHALDLKLARIVVTSSRQEGASNVKEEEVVDVDQIVFEEEDNREYVLRLLDPDGFLFSNTILSGIFLELGVV